MNVEVIPASPEQQTTLANLLELYAYDFSEFIDIKPGADGRFGYPDLHSYWQPDRYPFLILFNGDLAGFVFVRKGSQVSNDETVWDIAEFFILRSYRRRGIGTRVAHEIWDKFSGKWEVRVIDRNQKAREFWARAIAELLGRQITPTPFEKKGEGWQLFSFAVTNQ